MYPDSPFARPVSSFRRSAPVIDIDPDVDTDMTVCFRSEWVPYIVGALRQLLLQSTWATTDPDVLNLMQARAQLLIALFMEGCNVASFDVRQNTDDPCELDKTTDGGATWAQWATLNICPPDLILDGGILKIKRGGSYVPVDGTGEYDERQDGTYTPPWPTGTVPSGETGNCLAAENIVAFFASSLTQVKQGLDVGTPVATSMGIVAGTIGFLAFISAGVFAAVGLIIAGLLSALGSAGIDDMLTDDTLDKFKCAISCHAESDGSITADEFNAIYDEVGSTIPGVKGEIIQNWLNGFGPVGLSRQGHAADITSGSCTGCDCGWSYLWDLTASDGGWIPYAGSIGTWIAGVGWQSVGGQVTIQNAVSTGHYYRVSFGLDVTGSIGGGNHADVYQEDFTALLTVGLTGGIQTETWNGDIGAPRTDNPWISAYNNGSALMTVISARIDGNGTPPAFTGGAFI